MQQQQTFRKMQNYLWKLTSGKFAPFPLHHQRIMMNIAPSYSPIQLFGRNLSSKWWGDFQKWYMDWFCDLVQEGHFWGDPNQIHTWYLSPASLAVLLEKISAVWRNIVHLVLLQITRFSVGKNWAKNLAWREKLQFVGDTWRKTSWWLNANFVTDFGMLS